MNNNLNLCEILKDCLKNTKLYCTFLGDVTFQCIEEDRIIIKSDCGSYSFGKDGTFSPDGECVLFPSREQRDWSKFKIPVKKFDPKSFKPFDKVLLRSESKNIYTWTPSFFQKLSKKSDGGYFIVELCTGYSWENCIPYNDKTKQLSETTNDCSEYYKWWEK